MTHVASFCFVSFFRFNFNVRVLKAVCLETEQNERVSIIRQMLLELYDFIDWIVH